MLMSTAHISLTWLIRLKSLARSCVCVCGIFLNEGKATLHSYPNRMYIPCNRYDRMGRRNPQTWIAIRNQTDYFFSKRTHVRPLLQSKKGFDRTGEPSLRHALHHGKIRSSPTARPFKRRRFTPPHGVIHIQIARVRASASSSPLCTATTVRCRGHLHGTRNNQIIA